MAQLNHKLLESHLMEKGKMGSQGISPGKHAQGARTG